VTRIDSGTDPEFRTVKVPVVLVPGPRTAVFIAVVLLTLTVAVAERTVVAAVLAVPFQSAYVPPVPRSAVPTATTRASATGHTQRCRRAARWRPVVRGVAVMCLLLVVVVGGVRSVDQEPIAVWVSVKASALRLIEPP
jgi:hypothetical protein